MKTLSSLVIAGALLLTLTAAADAGQRRTPVLQQVNSSIQMVSIRHNHAKALLLVRRTPGN